jgi:putative salt-induced outer membrane protein
MAFQGAPDTLRRMGPTSKRAGSGARRLHAILALALLACPSPLAAAELPPEARTMLQEAYPKERQTIVNVLKRLYPQSSDEIDRLVRQVDEQRKAKVERMGLIKGLRGEVALGGSYSTGNTREWGVSGTLALRREGKRWVHSLDLTADLKTEDGERTSERITANYLLRRNFQGSKWFAAGALRYERDPFAGFSRRFGQFVGPGYQIANNSRLKWDVMAGPGYRQTRSVDEANDKQFGLFARTTLGWQLNDTLKFGEDLSAAIGKGNDTYLSATSLTSDIYGGFALRLSFITELETKPPEHRKKLDTYSRASVVYVFQPH